MTFTHRPSFPDQPETHETHRIIAFNGMSCGGVTQALTAYRGTVWEWGAFGPTDYRQYGEADSRDEALELVKDAAIRAMEKWPGLLEERHALKEKSRESHNAWARRHGKPEALY